MALKKLQHIEIEDDFKLIMFQKNIKILLLLVLTKFYPLKGKFLTNQKL